MDLRMDRSSPGKYNSSMVNSGSLQVNSGRLLVNSVDLRLILYSDKHNMVAFLKKPNESVGFTEVVDFLKGTSLRTLANGTQQLIASIDSKEYTITEASVRSKLQLADATGIHNLSDAEIYAGLATLGPKSGGWDQFGSTVATALICLSGDFVPLLPAMLAGAAMDQGDGSAQPVEPYHTPVDPLPSTSLPPIPSSPLQSPPHSPLQSPPHSPLQSPPHSPLQSPPYSLPHYSSPRSYEVPLPKGNTSGSAEASIQLKELMKVLVSALEGEELEDQGRIIQDIDDDPLVSLFRDS
ncbi:hypothetical protein Tco_1468590, partial [Tanacetum coccineum]